jgi:hypothetical protein
LLLTLAPDDAAKYVKSFADAYVIGRVVPRADKPIRLI